MFPLPKVGCELVPLMKAQATGKPRKDPSTGYLLNHSLPSTDVTKIADPKRYVKNKRRKPAVLFFISEIAFSN